MDNVIVGPWIARPERALPLDTSVEAAGPNVIPFPKMRSQRRFGWLWKGVAERPQPDVQKTS